MVCDQRIDAYCFFLETDFGFIYHNAAAHMFTHMP